MGEVVWLRGPKGCQKSTKSTMDKKTIQQIVVLFTDNQPRARAAALSEVETVFEHQTIDAVARDFPNHANSKSLALLTLCMKRAEIWWESKDD